MHSTSERPAAPPPIPLAGSTQPIHPNEYIIMPKNIRKYSLTIFHTESGVIACFIKGTLLFNMHDRTTSRRREELKSRAICSRDGMLLPAGVLFVYKCGKNFALIRIPPLQSFSSIDSSCSLRTRPQLRP